MKPPSSIVVGPHRYTVRCDADTQDSLSAEGRYGDTRTMQHLIRVRSGVPHTAMADTLLHETLHTIWDQTPLRYWKDDAEEEAITAITPVLLDVLRRNRKLVKFLLADA